MSFDEHRSRLERATILKAFQEMSDELGRRGITGELCLFGGAVMVLAFAARVSTKDVDAVFQPTHPMREIVQHVGEANNFPENWLNDAAKSFVSARHETVTGNLPQFAHLRLTMPTPEYLLAMKCMASRVGAVETEADDVGDIIFLIRHLRLRNAPEVLSLVADYYPASRVPVKAQYLVESLFSEGKI
jgi:hypothetical protein